MPDGSEERFRTNCPSCYGRPVGECPDCGTLMGSEERVRVDHDPRHAAFHCSECGSDVPWWRIERFGDAVVSWACFSHLSEVCSELQRTDEQTQLVVMEHSS